MEKFSSLLINIAEHKDVQKLWGVSVFSVSADGWVFKWWVEDVVRYKT